MKHGLIAMGWVAGLWMVSAQEPVPMAYEVPPVFEVAGRLPPELVRGPHHRVRAMAASDGYLTHYTIDSDYGVFECAGRRELELRVREIGAIARLVEVSKGDLFAEGLKRSIEQPIDAVKNIIDRPVESVKAVPKTVGHFFQKVGSSVGNTAKKVGRRFEAAGEGEVDAGVALAETGKGIGRSAKSVAGFDKAKLDTARQLGVDPYSDNPRLQEEMEKVTWAFFAGGMPLRIVGVATGAGIAVTAARTVGLPEDIYDVTPGELALRDRTALEAMGADGALIDGILMNQALSVSKRHAIVVHLSRLPGEGRLELVGVAAGIETPAQAAFFEQALASLVARHGTSPYVDIKAFGRLPAGVTGGGLIEIAAPVDHVSWTDKVAAFANRDDLTGKRRLLLGGTLSEAAKRGFGAAGWEVVAGG